MIRNFTADQVPDQTGKNIVVTGANTGIGFEAAKVLAAQGATVLLGCRNPEKAADALARIRQAHPDAMVEHLPLDLADLASVRAAAETVTERFDQLHVLVNNAGVMVPPYTKTADGFELQMGVNHLGPFAFTGLLLPLLESTPDSRIVNTSSNGHRMGRIDFDDLQAEQSYNATKRYGDSKLANLLHTLELDKRLRAKQSGTIAVTVHPGGTETDLPRHVPKWFYGTMLAMAPLLRLFINQPPAGAWPTLLAATHPDVEGGQYFGPARWGQMSGPAKQVWGNAASRDATVAKRLWDVSVELTGVDPAL